MSQHAIEDTEVYARYLKENPSEVQTLFKELLINVTSFFRDAEAFAALEKDILPQLCKDKPDDYLFRVWVAGCATGEEAYSIAILLRELMDETQQEFKVQIYSTDLDDDAIAIARAGIYPPNIAQDVTPERLRRFFIKEDAGYRVKKEIREMVVFAIQNVIKDPPFTKLDLLSCRNLMIYLEAGTAEPADSSISLMRSNRAGCCFCRLRRASAIIPNCSHRSTANGSSIVPPIPSLFSRSDDATFCPGPQKLAAKHLRKL